jgi:hypothetical protein
VREGQDERRRGNIRWLEVGKFGQSFCAGRRPLRQSGSLAMFTAIRRASMCVSVFRFEERSTKLFDEGASRR